MRPPALPLGPEKGALRQVPERTRKVVACRRLDTVIIGVGCGRLAKLALPQPADEQCLQRRTIEATIEMGNQVRRYAGGRNGLVRERGEPGLPCRRLKSRQRPNLWLRIVRASGRCRERRDGCLLGHHEREEGPTNPLPDNSLRQGCVRR